MDAPLHVFTGNSNPALARAICDDLGVPLGAMGVTRFSDGECRIKIEENVRGGDVFLVQSTCPPVNEHLVELLLMIDAAKRASARRVTAVLPYYGYAPQDRKDEPRVPISAKLVANLLVAAGTNRLLCLDLHAGQLQGYFDIPVDHLYAAPVLAEHLKAMNLADPIVVSPDPGGVERARYLGERLKWPLAIVDKRRPAPNVAEVFHIIGDVAGKTVVLVDDMIDTAGTLTAAARALIERGRAKAVTAAATHAVFSGDALDRIAESPISAVVVTDTIPLKDGPAKDGAGGKVRTLSVAPLLAQAIRRIHSNESVSSLFR